jgi:hypothetical protein
MPSVSVKYYIALPNEEYRTAQIEVNGKEELYFDGISISECQQG